MALAIINKIQRLPKSSFPSPWSSAAAPIPKGSRGIGWLLARELSPGESGYARQRRNKLLLTGFFGVVLAYGTWILLELRLLPPFYSEDGMEEYFRLKSINLSNPDMDRIAEIHRMRKEKQEKAAAESRTQAATAATSGSPKTN